MPGFLDVIPFQSLDVAIFVVLQLNCFVTVEAIYKVLYSKPQLVGAVEYLDKSFLGRTLFWQQKMTANIILGWVIIPGSIDPYG